MTQKKPRRGPSTRADSPPRKPTGATFDGRDILGDQTDGEPPPPPPTPGAGRLCRPGAHDSRKRLRAKYHRARTGEPFKAYARGMAADGDDDDARTWLYNKGMRV